MFIADLPKTRRIRIGRHTLKHHSGRTIGERAVNNISVPCDPPHISGTPIHIIFFEIENIIMCHSCPDKVTTSCVQNTLRFSRGATCIKNKERVFCLHRFWRAFGCDGLNLIMKIIITPFFHFNIGACSANDQYAIDNAGNIAGGIAIGFKGNPF